jgi:hypothetical protein
MIEPVAHRWYKNLEDRRLFEVVALDEHSGAVEIQYFDGEIEEIDQDSWDELLIVPSAAPEDWSGPFDDLEKEDLADSDTIIDFRDWADFLVDIESKE